MQNSENTMSLIGWLTARMLRLYLTSLLCSCTEYRSTKVVSLRIFPVKRDTKVVEQIFEQVEVIEVISEVIVMDRRS